MSEPTAADRATALALVGPVTHYYLGNLEATPRHTPSCSGCERVAALAAALAAARAEERAACAELAEGHRPLGPDPLGPLHGAGRAHAAESIAAKIRARGIS